MDNFNFYPLNLKKAANEIKKMHTHRSEIYKKSFNSEEFKMFVEKISKMNAESLFLYMKCISDYDIDILARYVLINNFNINLKNIYLILKINLTAARFAIIYYQWQNVYNNCNSKYFILDLISHRNNDMNTFFNNSHLSAEILMSWINSDNVKKSVIRSLCSVMQNKNDINSAKEKYKIMLHTSLTTDIDAQFYAYCDRKAYLYLQNPDTDLFKIAQNFTITIQKDLLHNFLQVIYKSDLKLYRNLWSTAYNIIKEINSSRYNEFFCNSEYKEKEKYSLWYNINQVYKIFGEDERSRFWNGMILDCQYDVECKYNRIAMSILMKFGKFYVIEYKEKGPIYIIRESYYDSVIKQRYLKCLTTQDVTDFKSLMYNKYSHDSDVFRYVHKSGWQYTIKNDLNKLLSLP